MEEVCIDRSQRTNPPPVGSTFRLPFCGQGWQWDQDDKRAHLLPGPQIQFGVTRKNFRTHRN